MTTGSHASLQTPLHVSALSAENQYVKIAFTNSGALSSIKDKRTGREVLAAEGNVLELFEEDSLKSSSWESFLTGRRLSVTLVGAPEWVERGPVRAMRRARYRTEESTFSVDTILYASVPRVEFLAELDWYDKDKLLAVRFPTAVRQGLATFERPYGFEETRPDGSRQCAQQWVDLSQEGLGASLLNEGNYEFYADGNVLRMGIVRSARDMDPRMDEGRHTFRYAVTPHAGSWRNGGTVQQAYQINNPLVAMQESRHSGVLAPWGNRRGDFSLPAEKSFLSVAPANIVVTVVKAQQEDWTPRAMVVRLLETAGRTARSTLSTPFELAAAEETNHIEEPFGKPTFQGKELVFEMKPREIKTFRLYFRGSGHE